MIFTLGKQDRRIIGFGVPLVACLFYFFVMLGNKPGPPMCGILDLFFRPEVLSDISCFVIVIWLVVNIVSLLFKLKFQ